jgi:hypothetical protein
MSEDPRPAEEDIPEEDIGPYGLRGKHTPPLSRMFGGYAIIFAAVVLIPLILFALVRFVIL